MYFTMITQEAVDHVDYTWTYTGRCFATGILASQLTLHSNLTLHMCLYTVEDDTNNIYLHTSYFPKSK